MLAHLGRAVPPPRSGDRWEDRDATSRVRTVRPSNLFHFNATDDACGAHVGVCAGADTVLRLCLCRGTGTDVAARERHRGTGRREAAAGAG